MNKILSLSILIIMLFLIWASFAAAAPDMKEGQWEVTISSKMDMQGMSMAMPPVTYKQCLTKTDFVPNKKEPGQECEKMSVNVSGNTVTWSIKCKSKEGIMTGSGKITYKGNTYDGVMNMAFPNQGGGEGKMTSNMSGKWIGNCK
ncbi:MAG: DUF3617 domain-containing protein [Desulfobacteraceae bacterium]|nr:MAG: DUF3617 domain-containing protein [Desulfobacteraceae bacterium]